MSYWSAIIWAFAAGVWSTHLVSWLTKKWLERGKS